MGWSTGGGVAMVLAIKIPEFIARIILLGSIGIDGIPVLKKVNN